MRPRLPVAAGAPNGCEEEDGNATTSGEEPLLSWAVECAPRNSTSPVTSRVWPALAACRCCRERARPLAVAALKASIAWRDGMVSTAPNWLLLPAVCDGAE